MLREKLLLFAVKQFTILGLPVLLANVDYRGSKPDLVLVYTDKKKYYLVNVISEESFSPNNKQRVMGYDFMSREYCKYLYPDKRKVVWAENLFCDLGQAVELFGYSELRGINFDLMKKYAAILYPLSLEEEANKIFNDFDLQVRVMDISNIFKLALFSFSDSKRFAEVRRLMQFIASNRSDI